MLNHLILNIGTQTSQCRLNVFSRHCWCPTHVLSAVTSAGLPPVNSFNSLPQDVMHTLGLHAGQSENPEESELLEASPHQ